MNSLDTIFDQKERESRSILQDIAAKALSENRSLTVAESTRSATVIADLKGLAELRAQTAEKNAVGAEVQASLRGLADSPVVATMAANRSSEKEIEQRFRSAVIEKNPSPIDVRNPSPRSFYQPGIEARTGLATNAPANTYTGVGFYQRLLANMVETSAVLRAGATVFQTDSGEPMRIPRQTALPTATLVAEQAVIPEGDPTLSAVTLGAYKYAFLVSVSNELVEDIAFDLNGYLASQAGIAIGNAFGNDLLTGNGTGKPLGVASQATLGVTGPTGTATSLGAQGTAGMGTDLINNLVSALPEPYTMSPAFGFLARNATINAIRNLKGTTGDLVGMQYLNEGPGKFHVDPYMPAMAANAQSILAGDWSRVIVRMVNGLRFEMSRDYAWNTDQTVFRAVFRADGTLVDTTGAIKFFQNSAT